MFPSPETATAGFVSDQDAAKFISIVRSCVDLQPDCESWQEAAAVACENHEVSFSDINLRRTNEALSIVICCAMDEESNDPYLDLLFWSGEFADCFLRGRSGVAA